MPIEEIKEKILGDAKKKEQEIIDEVKKERDRIIREAKEKAKQKEEEAALIAKKKAEEMDKEYIAEYSIESHNAELLAQETLARRWLRKVESEIENNIIKNYQKIIKNAVERISSEGYGYKIKSEKKLAPMLEKLGYKTENCENGVLVMSSDERISIDVTPKKLADEYEEEAKGIIIRTLFKEKGRNEEGKIGKNKKGKKKVGR
ncbi:MAG: hypothetical protein ACP5RT_01565 [Candidatus Micrarchaeia archaeon]